MLNEVRPSVLSQPGDIPLWKFSDWTNTTNPQLTGCPCLLWTLDAAWPYVCLHAVQALLKLECASQKHRSFDAESGPSMIDRERHVINQNVYQNRNSLETFCRIDMHMQNCELKTCVRIGHVQPDYDTPLACKHAVHFKQAMLPAGSGIFLIGEHRLMPFSLGWRQSGALGYGWNWIVSMVSIYTDSHIHHLQCSQTMHSLSSANQSWNFLDHPATILL